MCTVRMHYNIRVWFWGNRFPKETARLLGILTFD